MCIQKIGAVLALLLLFTGCAPTGAVPDGAEGQDELSIAALFQTEAGDALYGSTACFSTEDSSNSCQVGRSGTASASGLPRNGELLLTLFDQQQEVQGAITLSLSKGSVTDAMTGEDGVGYVTVRDGTSQVALIFVLTEDGALRCTLWLTGAVPSDTDLPQKGV